MKKIIGNSLTALLLVLLLSWESVAQSAGKIWIDNDYLYVNILQKGVLIFDNLDPKKPKKVGFVEINGNVDIAVVGKTLYANSFEDLVVIDLNDLNAPKEANRIKGVFNHRRSTNNSGNNPVAWRAGSEAESFLATLLNSINPAFNANNNRNTFGNAFGGGGIGFTPSIVTNAQATTNTSGGGSGQGGSMACFSIKDSYLYAIDANNLHVFDIIKPLSPLKTGYTLPVSSDIETVFTSEKQLFIGSQSGMYIYDIDKRTEPRQVGVYKHTRSCDPVVVEGNYAYITMRNGVDCAGDVNQLDVVDISRASDPKKVRSYRMNNPHGLGIDNGTLFICDGRDGLKVFDASNPNDVRQIAHFSQIDTYDVIPNSARKILVMVGTNRIFQYDYTNPQNITLISETPIVAAN